MPYVMTVNPDFSPNYIAGWYIFNTWLQRELNTKIHLELYNNFDQQRAAIQHDKIDIIYANPFDASQLVREKDFLAIAAPGKYSDETIIAVNQNSAIKKIEDLRKNIKIAKIDNPNINMMGMIMLEPANLNKNNVINLTVDAYILVAKALIQDKADIGFFLKEAYENLSPLVKRNLRKLITSKINIIRHVLLISPKFKNKQQELTKLLLTMGDSVKGRSVLTSLNLTYWEKQTQEDTEFMIDLMDTLID